MKKLVPFAVAVFSLVVAGCGSSTSSTAGYSPNNPSAVIGIVGSAVSTVGSGLVTSRRIANQRGFTSADCDTHGDPKSGGSQMSQTDPKFPGTLTYCKLTTNDYSPETVQGAFALPKSLSCALEKAGITFDGVARDVTVTFNTDCFTSAQLSDMGMSTGQTATFSVTASKPAAFNSYFDSGVRIYSASFQVDYTLGVKIGTDTVEFASIEAATNKNGGFAGALNLTTGQLWYEGRMERILCSTSGSCGWNRHVRAMANLTLTNGQPSGLKDFSLGYMNVQAPPGQSGYGGYLVTAVGNLTDGVKARAWTPSSITAISDYDTISKWNETTNTYCYTKTSDTATTCGTGLPLFSTNTNFLLTNAGHKSPSAFTSAYAGMSFTQVDVDKDVQ